MSSAKNGGKTMPNRYFDFLCSLVGRSEEYSLLLSKLQRIEFYSLIPNDDNRVADGLYLRSLFSDEVGQNWPTSSSESCSVLEMLIGLARRLEFETAQSKWEKTVSEWFWILIDNLGLISCTDVVYNTNESVEDSIDLVVNTMISREYDSNGNGGLFPIKDSHKDQRRMEIWYQMTDYILENYPINF